MMWARAIAVFQNKRNWNFPINSRNLEEICNRRYIGKKVINCGVDNPMGFTENALEKQ